MRKCDTMDSQMHLIGNATRPLYTDPVFENHTIIGDARSHTNHDIYIYIYILLCTSICLCI